MTASSEGRRSSDDDTALPFQLDALGVRGRLVRLGPALDAVIERHGYPLAVARPLAEAMVQQFQSYRTRTKAAMSARDATVELGELAELVKSLGSQNDDFSRAASEWSDDARARKRELRKQRDQTFQRIKVVLARLGAREQLSALERLPFQARVEKLAQYVSAQSQGR